MKINVNNSQELQVYVNKVDSLVKENHNLEWVKYITLGSKTIRLLGYSKDFLKHIERQLTYIIKDEADSYDATIVLWHMDNNEVKVLKDDFLSGFNPHKLRLEMLLNKGKPFNISVHNSEDANISPSIMFDINRGFMNVYDSLDNTYYYGVNDLSIEYFITEGHVLVQFFNKITKSDNKALVHGALVGLDNQGVLFCARGQRGKSTLSVLSMMDGFDYVSDDYLVLEKENDKLYTDPIYSIITLSPRMYDELYDKLEGSRFISNNGRKDKYVVNISNYHEQFRSKYPVKFCMFPEIVSDEEPSIVPCPKGRAICQLVQSTVCQLQDVNNHDVVKKIKDMVFDYEFYQINLCQDIQKNTDCLRDFINNYDKREIKTFVEGRMYEDMVFDETHILDSKTNTIYFLNKFSTIIYKNLKEGVCKDLLLDRLKTISNMPNTIEQDFKSLIMALQDKGLLKDINSSKQEFNIDEDLIKESKYKLVFNEFLQSGTKNLVIEYKKER